MQFGGAANDYPITAGPASGNDGSLILGGYTEDSIDGTVSAGGIDSWLRRVGRRGNAVWTIQFGDDFDDAIRNIWRNPVGDASTP